MSKQGRIATSRPEDLVKTKITDMIVGNNTGKNRTFYFGQVVDSVDPKNSNRMRVRIPLLDDVFYLDDSGQLSEDAGHDKLPFCISAHGRYVEMPENGTVVLVGLMDPSNPFLGRVWFTAVEDLSDTDLFDPARLIEESDPAVAWPNIESATNVRYNNTPGVRGRAAIQSKEKQTNFKVGIRGKNKNKILLDEDKTTIIQGEGEDTESSIEVAENLKIHASDEIEILSDKNSNSYGPMFGAPNYTFQQSLLDLINQIVTLLTTSPATTTYPGSPCSPAPSAAAIQAAYQRLSADFKKLKRAGEGASKQIKIN